MYFKVFPLHVSAWSGITFSEVVPPWQGYMTAVALPISKRIASHSFKIYMVFIKLFKQFADVKYFTSEEKCFYSP